MNYYRRYVADYLADTQLLAMIEDGAYGRLLDYYYAKERPLPRDLERIFTLARATKPQEQEAVRNVLAEHFTLEDDGYHNRRADKEIAIAQQARDNGAKGGRPRTKIPNEETRKVTDDETPDRTEERTEKVTGEGGGSGHPPTTNHQPPSPNLQKHTPAPKRPAAVREGYSADFKRAWDLYPDRLGGSNKRAAWKAWQARLRSGATPDDIVEGVKRYAVFIARTGKAGTQYVKSAETFFGPDEHFRASWALGGNVKTGTAPTWRAGAEPSEVLKKAGEKLGIHPWQSEDGETHGQFRRRIVDAGGEELLKPPVRSGFDARLVA